MDMSIPAMGRMEIRELPSGLSVLTPLWDPGIEPDSSGLCDHIIQQLDFVLLLHESSD